MQANMPMFISKENFCYQVEQEAIQIISEYIDSTGPSDVCSC